MPISYKCGTSILIRYIRIIDHQGILMVDSLPTLIEASRILGIPLGMTWGSTGQGVPGQGAMKGESSGVRLWVGVDSEWRAVITRKKTPYSSAPVHGQGAAILQVTIYSLNLLFLK